MDALLVGGPLDGEIRPILSRRLIVPTLTWPVIRHVDAGPHGEPVITYDTGAVIYELRRSGDTLQYVMQDQH